MRTPHWMPSVHELYMCALALVQTSINWQYHVFVNDERISVALVVQSAHLRISGALEKIQMRHFDNFPPQMHLARYLRIRGLSRHLAVICCGCYGVVEDCYTPEIRNTNQNVLTEKYLYVDR